MSLLEVVRQHDDATGRPADLAIVGTAKNVGKTTTFNWLLERLEDDLALGLTSVGRDGEDIDAVTDLPKPRITPPVGSLIATSETSAKRSGSRLALLEPTPFRTALGQVAIYRVAASGPVEISGPVAVADAADVRRRLHAAGAGRVLVDGAIDRKASASSRVADGVVLATGLALLDAGGGRLAGPREVPGKAATSAPERPRSDGERIEAVVRQSAAILRMLALPGSGLNDQDRHTGAVMPGGRFLPWDGTTVLEHGDVLIQWLPPEAEALVLSGALTEGVAQALLRGGREQLQLVVPDGTHVLCSPESFDRLQERGLSLRAARPIRVLAVTVNPSSPHVPGVDPHALLEAMRRAVPLPVFDLAALP